MEVALSSGLGRLHFFSTAQALCEQGICVRLICGWVPKKTDSLLTRLFSRIVGYDLRSGLKKRQLRTQNLTVCPCPLSDFFDKVLILFFRKILISIGIDPIWGWKLFGFQSRKYLKGCNIFHVRSGAGHGGAIKYARKLGIAIVVDHSIAHPAFMDANIRDECQRMSVPFDLGMDSPFWRMVLEDCDLADVLLVNSYFVKDTFVQNGYPEEKIRVVYLGVPRAFMGVHSFLKAYSQQRVWSFLFTGAFGFRKGGEYLLEAMKLLKGTTEYKFNLKCVGSTSQGEALITKYAADDLPVEFLGPKPQEMLMDYMREADIYVFPSLAEGCAKSGMEAMAAGMCVVATYESGLPIEDGVTGYIIPAKDAEALMERLNWLMLHPENIVRTGKAAAELIARNYSDEAYANNLKAVYNGLMEDRK